jgi:hypothetical protein
MALSSQEYIQFRPEQTTRNDVDCGSDDVHHKPSDQTGTRHVKEMYSLFSEGSETCNPDFI